MKVASGEQQGNMVFEIYTIQLCLRSGILASTWFGVELQLNQVATGSQQKIANALRRWAKDRSQLCRHDTSGHFQIRSRARSQ